MFFQSKKKVTRSITFMPTKQTALVEPGQTILEAAIESGIDLPYSCGVGSCKSCMVVLESGKITSLIDVDYILEIDEIEKNYILCCQSLVDENVVISLIL
jgi:ferredoxin